MNPSCRITRLRRLPAMGQVLVKAGQSVTTNDVVAAIDMPEKHMDVDVAGGLMLAPPKADRSILVKPGEIIHAGDLIARRGGLAPRAIFSPVDGRVVDCANARVLIEVGANPLVVRAGFRGVVKEVVAGYGAILMTEGAVLQGVWGNGKLAEGLMICLARAQNEELKPERMDVSLRGSVVLGGPCLREDVLRFASEIPLRGLIISGLAPELQDMAEALPFPVLVLIGLGKVSYDNHSYQIVSSIDKRVVCVNAVPWDRSAGTRPEMVVPHHGEIPAAELVEDADYRKGQLVRILQSPYLWETARIKELNLEPRTYPGGIIAQSALCVLNNGDEIAQPLVNLEVIL